MKLYYFIAIVVLIILIIFVTLSQLSYYPPVVEERIYTDTDKLLKAENINYEEPLEQQTTQDIKPKVWQNNLFDPARGNIADTAAGNQNLSTLELIGICDIGDIKGAIIIKNPNAQSGQSPYGQPYQPYQPPGNMNQNTPQTPVKKFFKLGEKILDTELTLIELKQNSVILKNSSGQDETLSIKYGSVQSEVRIQNGLQNNVQAQIQQIEQERLQKLKPKLEVDVSPATENPELENIERRIAKLKQRINEEKREEEKRKLEQELRVLQREADAFSKK